MAHQRIKNEICPNCGFRFDLQSPYTNYCPECGQENHDLNIPLKNLVKEFIDSVFNFDGKSVRTLKALIFKPGLLTVEFMLGRRASYVMPVRLYVFISFLFFLAISISSSQSGESSSGGLSISFRGIYSKELRGLSDPQIDSLMTARNIETTAFSVYILRQIRRVESGGERALAQLIIKGVSYMMFFLMPFFAFLVFIFYRKRAVNYLGTLVYSLHFHCYAFLLMAALFLLSRIPFMSLLPLLTPVILAIYLHLSLRTVFKQPGIMALLKMLIIGLLHVASVALLFLATVFASIILF